MHAWYVYESGMTARTYESMSPVGPAVLGVMFDKRSECWTCDCAPNDLQPSVMGQICDHVYTVCKQLVGVKGPWEQDAELMQRAWDAVRPRVRREDNPKRNYYESIARLMSNQMSVEELSKLSKSIISDTGALSELTKDMASGGMFTGTSTAADEYKTARVSYDEKKGVQFTIDGEDITKDVKIAKIGRSSADSGEVTVTLNGMPYKDKVNGLKANDLIVDEFNEHKEPEKPKKKKSRFTEIDL